MVSGKKYNGFNIDIWSTGIILYAMICGFLPFEDKDNDVLFKKILKCKIEYPKFISKNVKSLLKKIIVSDPDKRIKIEDIKKEPFYLLGKNVFKDKHPELFVEDNVNFNINDNIIRNNVIYTISNSNVDNFNIDSDRNGNTNFNTLSTYKIKKNSLIDDNNNDIKNNKDEPLYDGNRNRDFHFDKIYEQRYNWKDFLLCLQDSINNAMNNSSDDTNSVIKDLIEEIKEGNFLKALREQFRLKRFGNNIISECSKKLNPMNGGHDSRRDHNNNDNDRRRDHNNNDNNRRRDHNNNDNDRGRDHNNNDNDRGRDHNRNNNNDHNRNGY